MKAAFSKLYRFSGAVYWLLLATGLIWVPVAILFINPCLGRDTGAVIILRTYHILKPALILYGIVVGLSFIFHGMSKRIHRKYFRSKNRGGASFTNNF